MHRSQLLAAIVDSSDDAILAFDAQGAIVSWNRAAEALYGYAAAEVLGKPCSLIVPPELRDASERLTARVLAGETVRHHQTVRLAKSGARVSVSASLSPLRDEGGRIIGRLAIHRDVTDARRTEARLLEQERLLDAVNDAVLTTDEQLRLAYWNRASEALYGWTAGEVLGRNAREVLQTRPIGIERDALVARLMAEGAWSGECLQARKDGSWVRVEAATVALKDPSEAFQGLITVNRDITARHAAQEEARRTEAQLAEAQRIAQVGSWSRGPGPDELTWSPEFARLFGLESVPRHSTEAFLARVHPDDRARLVDTLRAAHAEAGAFEFEHRVLLPDGTVRRLLARGRAEVDADGRVVRMTGTALDLTDRLALEARVQQADRMASLGLLAAGVAHEINNPLAYLMSNLEFVTRLVEKHPPSGLAGADGGAGQALSDALHGALRVRDIVRDLQTFARAEEVSSAALALPAALDAAANLAANQVRHRARLIKEYGASPQVLGSEARLVQVFVNLLVNAAQSIPEGRAEHHQIRIVVSTDARGWAVVEVGDTGAGIPPEAMGRLFDPFFTTKPLGVGTGLGLSICQGIVGAMGGTIEVRSELGRGTVARVCLPPASPDAPRAAAPASAAAPAQAPARRGGRILVIDDEPRVVTAIGRVLAGDHTVISTTSSEEALQLLLGATTFDVIFCDVMMPNVSGIALYQQLQRARPSAAARVVFITGGVFASDARAFLEQFTGRVLEKPFSPHQLQAVVDAMLQAAPEPGAP